MREASGFTWNMAGCAVGEGFMRKADAGAALSSPTSDAFHVKQEEPRRVSSVVAIAAEAVVASPR